MHNGIQRGVYSAVRSAGGQSSLATALGVSQQAINKWVKRGYFPLRRAQEIEAIYGIPRRELIDPRILDLVDLPTDDEGGEF